MISSLGTLLIAGLTGFFLGVMYFAWLWRSVSALASSGGLLAGFVMDTVLRFMALAAVVGVLLWLDTAPLLLLVGGLAFFIARLLMTAVLGRATSEA